LQREKQTAVLALLLCTLVLARLGVADASKTYRIPFHTVGGMILLDAVVAATMAGTEGNGFSAWAQPAQFRLASSAYLRCPNCNSTDLEKVSLAYQEGLFYADAYTRLRAVVVGGSGPDLVIGRATTRGFHQSVLSKQLNPPVKWSYRKLILWWAVVFLSIGWIIFYINTITKKLSLLFCRFR
jgi:cytochrome c-type biogenesis protein CcmH/NrfF